ncbi:hypothetical protein [Quatrionicoccus australiensis]|uniref:hypothetical protein n=1 Tax=Quatrionicoccus australiensis TaxID=138118 RepID=UPI001CF9A55F|nr:hypothetical protein [Quatrionicoccus australiensis]MCB4361767.1 hypothetical protein [Quatrionicoccus australiensis]
MNPSTLFLGGTALLLAVLLGGGRSVVAGTEAPATIDAGENLSIRSLQRAGRTPRAEPVGIPLRDPFAGETPLAASSEPPTFAPVHAALPVVPAFPDFRVIGKQQDDTGWAVFIGEPGKQGQVWVVREGESFNDGFKVSKLAPPLLVIKRLRGRQSRTFDIGKDEIEE